MGKILDAGRWKPPTRMVFVDGEGAVERLPSIRSRRFMDPAGNVRFLALGNANAAAEEGATPYANEQIQFKQSQGWIPAGQCPAALVMSNQINHDRVCAKAREGSPCAPGTYSMEQPCHHFLVEQQTRLARHKKVNDEREAKHNKEELLRNETQNKLNTVLEKLSDRIVEQDVAPKKGKGRSDD